MPRQIREDDFVWITRVGEDRVLHAVRSISQSKDSKEFTVYPLDNQTNETVIILKDGERSFWRGRVDGSDGMKEDCNGCAFMFVYYEDKPNEENEEILYDLITDGGQGVENPEYDIYPQIPRGMSSISILNQMLEDPSPYGITRKQIIEKLGIPFDGEHPYPDFTHQYVEWMLDRGYDASGPYSEGYNPYTFMQGMTGLDEQDYEKAFQLLDRLNAVSKTNWSPFTAVLSYKELVNKGL